MRKFLYCITLFMLFVTIPLNSYAYKTPIVINDIITLAAGKDARYNIIAYNCPYNSGVDTRNFEAIEGSPNSYRCILLISKIPNEFTHTINEKMKMRIYDVYMFLEDNSYVYSFPIYCFGTEKFSIPSYNTHTKPVLLQGRIITDLVQSGAQGKRGPITLKKEYPIVQYILKDITEHK